jgi:hypothetical protein
VLKDEQLLETILEAIRKRRRRGPFPTPFDLSHLLYNVENKRIEMNLQDEGKTRSFQLQLIEVVALEVDIVAEES